MAIPQRKTLTGLLGALTGILLAAALVLFLNLDSWARWWEGVGKSHRGQAQQAALPMPAPTMQRPSEALTVWTRLPAHTQVDSVMLGLTQALENLGMQVQSMQVLADVAKPVKEKMSAEGPQALLSISLLATYGQWMQWWETSQSEGVAWWPVQLSMSPAAGQTRLQIDGQWRVLLSDQERAQGAWTQDVHDWVPARMALQQDPFGLTRLSLTGALAPAGAGALTQAASSDRSPCPKDSLKSAVQGLQLVGLLEGGGRHPGQAVLREGACQWVVRVGQRVGRQGHVLHSVGPGASVWLAREDQSGGQRLKIHKRERP
ncbi:MAG: hypothetical protein RLZ63_1003 [Pseudomonadota bacterium]|jgi:hypothetical protein